MPLSTSFVEDLISVLFSSGSQGVYYDPSDFSTMFQDAAGTVPVTALGQPVGLIRDKSGRGNHASQSTTTKRPLIQQDAAGAYYLSFDGIDDALATNNIDFTGGDQVTMFAGFRKLSDAAAGMVCEFGAGFVNGGFYITAPNGASPTFGGQSQGTISTGIQISGFASPVSAVLSEYHSISGDLITIKANGITGTPVTGDKGTGNFSNYPLYIGARGGSLLPFNGRLYCLAIVASDARAQEDAIDKYISNKMGGIY